jgi:SNF2 family DNA or RNA helicase
LKYQFKTEPFAHQKTALLRSWNKPNYGFFMEMGTGKSKVLIDTIGILYGKGAINAVVIVAPKGVYRNWSTKEIPDHMPDYIDTHIAVWSPAPRKQEKADLVKLFHTDLDKLKIFLINVEAFSTPKGVKFTENFILSHQVLFAVDESTTIKNPKASRTKAITKLAKNTKYRRILTGSPITQSPLDLYSQTEVLDTNLLGYTSFYSFQNHYGEVVNRYFGGRTVRQVVGYRNLDELSQKLDSFSYRVLKSDCLDLPEKLYIRRDVTLTAEQKKLYSELKELAITELANQETVSVTNVLTQLLRLHQIVCGHIKSDDGIETPINNNRIDELIEVIAEMQGKVIIWANYRQNILEIVETLQGLFGADAVASYFGDTTPDERERVIKQFQNPDSPLRFFVGNTQTGGYGITLTEAQNVIYYSNNFDLEKRLQSEDRAHRIGQKNNVTYVDLVAKDTVDEKIVTALRNKLDLAQEVLGDDKWENWLT